MRNGPSQPIGNLFQTTQILAQARARAGVTEIPTVAGTSAPPDPKPNSPEDVGFTNLQTPKPAAPAHGPKKCGSCPARILWAQSLDEQGQRIWDEERKRFKAMPVDWEPVPTGNVVVFERMGEGFVCRVLKKGETPPPGARLRTSHFALSERTAAPESTMTAAEKRRALLVGGAIEAARSVMAHQLVRERRMGLADVTCEEAEALQTLRDALAVERRTRSER